MEMHGRPEALLDSKAGTMHLTAMLKAAAPILLLISFAARNDAVAAPRASRLAVKSILVTLEYEECKKSYAGGASSPGTCDGSIAEISRYRFVGNKILSETIAFQRIGNATRIHNVAANNGAIFIVGETFDLLKRKDLPKPELLNRNFRPENSMFSARYRQGRLYLASNTMLVSQIDDASVENHETLELDFNPEGCAVSGYSSTSTTTLRARAMKAEFRYVLTRSSCAVEG
jgi:hypothetical protein